MYSIHAVLTVQVYVEISLNLINLGPNTHAVRLQYLYLTKTFRVRRLKPHISSGTEVVVS